MADHDYVDDLVKTLPDAYQVLARNGLYGDYFGFYLCDAILKVNGKGGQPVYRQARGPGHGTVHTEMNRPEVQAAQHQTARRAQPGRRRRSSESLF